MEGMWRKERKYEKKSDGKKRGQQQSEAITGRDEERENRQRFAGLGGGGKKSWEILKSR